MAVITLSVITALKALSGCILSTSRFHISLKSRGSRLPSHKRGIFRKEKLKDGKVGGGGTAKDSPWLLLLAVCMAHMGRRFHNSRALLELHKQNSSVNFLNGCGRVAMYVSVKPDASLYLEVTFDSVDNYAFKLVPASTSGH